MSAAPRSPWIAGRAYDAVFFLGPPILALVLGAIVGLLRLDEPRFWLEGRRVGYVALALGAFIHAHLAAVYLRSHGNPDIFRRHRLRFLLTPPLLLAALLASETISVVATAVVVFWDVYHSAAQTFGFGRLYDARAGNDPAVGRRLDLGLNVLLYVGPILAGATMIEHLKSLETLDVIGLAFLGEVPAALDGARGVVASVVLAAGLAYVGAYVLAYAALSRRGYRVSRAKVFLFASTGLVSIVAWGWNPLGQAFLIQNVAHALQYLGMVWFTDGRRLAGKARLGWAGPLVFLALLFTYGVFADLANEEGGRVMWCVAQAVALTHFWFDGFIWSARKRDA